MGKPQGMVGAAGEYYVLSMLYLEGFVAALAPKGTKTADILVLDPFAKDVIASVQVKARLKGRDGGWHMKAHHETWVSEGLFYAFVDFQPTSPPSPHRVYVIPSNIVANAVGENHKQWLALPNKKGGKHNDHDMRRLVPDFSVYKTSLANFPKGWMAQYEGKWDQLRPKSKKS